MAKVRLWLKGEDDPKKFIERDPVDARECIAMGAYTDVDPETGEGPQKSDEERQADEVARRNQQAAKDAAGGTSVKGAAKSK